MASNNESGTIHPLQTLLEEADFDIRSYSGRGMFGRRCLGVTVRNGGLGNLMAAIVTGVIEMAQGDVEEDAMPEEVSVAMESLSMDSMGLDTIVYWTEVPFTDAEDDETED